MDKKFGCRQICQILLGTTKKFRSKKCSSILHTALILLSIFLLWWTYNLYFYQKNFYLHTILQVIGEDRNTSVKLMPGIRTTLREPNHACQHAGKNALAIVLVTSKAESFDRREVIRSTWGSSEYDLDIMVFFFSGRPSSGNYKDLEKEAALHGDVIIEDLDENYYGLAIKTLRMLKWFQRNCPKSKFLIKADDDVYLNLPHMASQLSQLDTNFKLGGRVLSGRSPNLMNPFSKWYTPSEMWPLGSIPPTYLGGPCYIIRGSLVANLLEASCELPLYHLEDVFVTGMVANQRLKYELTSIPGTFDPKYPASWYFINKHFGDDSVISSLHTDGDFSLMKRVFLDVETSS